MPRSTAKAITGHKTNSVYDRYAITDSQTQKAAAEKLDIFHQATLTNLPTETSKNLLNGVAATGGTDSGSPLSSRLSSTRRGGRVVEGTRLLIWRTG